MTIFITLIRTLVIMHCSMQVQGFLHCTNLSIESSYLCTKKAKNAESLWGLLPCQSLSCPYFALVNFTAPPNCQITVHTFFNAEEFQGHFLSKKIYLVSIILQFIESTLGVQKVLLVAFMKKPWNFPIFSHCYGTSLLKMSVLWRDQTLSDRMAFSGKTW